MNVNYDFVSASESTAFKYRSDLVSYAGKLIELSGFRSLVIGLDNYDKPFIMACEGRLINPLETVFEE